MMTASILETIAAYKRLEVAVTRAMVSPAAVRERARRAPPPRDFAAALRDGGFALIAEIKRRSPAVGVLRDRLDPAETARRYVAGGARAISVLTDEWFFGGRPEDLREGMALAARSIDSGAAFERLEGLRMRTRVAVG